MESTAKKRNIKGPLLLLLTAVIWGTAFVAQSTGMDYVGPLTFNGSRCLIGGIVLLPCIQIMDRVSPSGRGKPDKQGRKTLLIAGILCGLALFAATNLQQIGIQYTTVGKAGFITAFYIVMVPVIQLIFGSRNRIGIWIAVALALAGLYLLCVTEQFSLGAGDIALFMSALLFAVQILIVDRYSPYVDGLRLSCTQFFVCGILTLICMFIFETPDIRDLLAAWKPLLYSGVLSCGVGYTLQILGQKDMNPTTASLIMSLESCMSVLAGWAILHQRLSVRELVGCAVMMVAIVIAQCGPRGVKNE